MRASWHCVNIAPWTSLRDDPCPRCPIRSRPKCGASWHYGRTAGAGSPIRGRFCAFSAPDAMYAPVALRFRTYLPELTPYGGDATTLSYIDALLALLAWWRGRKPRAEAGGPEPHRSSVTLS